MSIQVFLKPCQVEACRQWSIEKKRVYDPIGERNSSPEEKEKNWNEKRMNIFVGKVGEFAFGRWCFHHGLADRTSFFVQEENYHDKDFVFGDRVIDIKSTMGNGHCLIVDARNVTRSDIFVQVNVDWNYEKSDIHENHRATIIGFTSRKSLLQKKDGKQIHFYEKSSMFELENGKQFKNRWDNFVMNRSGLSKDFDLLLDMLQKESKKERSDSPLHYFFDEKGDLHVPVS